MAVLITGAAGFIGSHTAEHLLSTGHEVIGIDNFDPFYSKDIKINNLSYLEAYPGFKFVEVDICDKPALSDVFIANNVDSVIHLAAKAGVRPSIENIEDYYNVNINGTVNILECMKARGIKNLVFASSSSVYGNNKKVPFSEADSVDNPISPYASTKKSGELLCHVYSHLYNFNITCLRFFTVFGPRQRPDLAIHKFTKLIDQGKGIPFFGDGSTARDYTFVSDIVQGVVLALKKLNGFNIYNLGESKTITLTQLVDLMGKLLGKEVILNKFPKQDGDVELTYADISKAKAELGYQPKVNMEEGLTSFIEWFYKNTVQ